MARLAGLNERVARFILVALDRDAGRPSATNGIGDGTELGRDLVTLGKDVRRYARLRGASWGHTYIEPQVGHVRETENGTAAVSVIDGVAVGPAVCGAWLVADLPDPSSEEVTPCSVCLATLGHEP